jgi:RimJ/RimL family protein N-acetyltransferase
MLVNRFFAAMVNGKDSAIMSIEESAGDFGSKIWLGGCWVHPDVRGTGIMSAMVEFIDSVASVRDWSCQGLGVWLDNHSAIAAYEKLGFVQVGETQESTRQPGKYYQRMIRHTK